MVVITGRNGIPKAESAKFKESLKKSLLEQLLHVHPFNPLKPKQKSRSKEKMLGGEVRDTLFLGGGGGLNRKNFL
jgi:hypothetical protein